MPVRACDAGWLVLGLALGAAAVAAWRSAGDVPAAPDGSDVAAENDRLRRENAELREDATRRPRARAERADRDPEPLADAGSPKPEGAEPRFVRRDDRSRLTFTFTFGEPTEKPVTLFEHASTPVADLVQKLRDAVAAGDLATARTLAAALSLRRDEAVDPLMSMVRDLSAPEPLRNLAFETLQSLHAPGLAALVENLYLSRPADGGPSDATRVAALKAAVGGDPESAQAVVQRLLWSPQAADREVAIAGLTAARDPSFLPLLRDEVMRPGAVPSTRNLVDTIATLRGKRWSAVQATGEPDTPDNGDLSTAWASKAADMGEVNLELDYAAAVVPDAVRIRETLAPGAVARVEGRVEDGSWTVLWEGRGSGEAAPRWFETALARAPSRVRTIRLVLDTDRVPGWNEIDAVELVGEGRRQWAAAARASSSYADP
jgi:hypothetical protein